MLGSEKGLPFLSEYYDRKIEAEKFIWKNVETSNPASYAQALSLMVSIAAGLFLLVKRVIFCSCIMKWPKRFP